MCVIGFRDAVGSGFVCALFVSARSIHRFCFNCEYNKPALGVLFWSLVTFCLFLAYGERLQVKHIVFVLVGVVFSGERMVYTFLLFIVGKHLFIAPL